MSLIDASSFPLIWILFLIETPSLSLLNLNYVSDASSLSLIWIMSLIEVPSLPLIWIMSLIETPLLPLIWIMSIIQAPFTSINLNNVPDSGNYHVYKLVLVYCLERNLVPQIYPISIIRIKGSRVLRRMFMSLCSLPKSVNNNN